MRALLVLVILAAPRMVEAAVGARFLDPVAVEGEHLRVLVELLDDPGVASRVRVELRRGEGPWQGVSARARDGLWQADFRSLDPPLSEAETLELRATVFGRRGGILARLAHDAPLDVVVLSVERARARARDLRRADGALEGSGSDVAGLVGLQARVGEPARIRALVGASVPLRPGTALVARATAGPVFAAPEGRDGGALGMGFELAGRFLGRPTGPGGWSSFGGPLVALELRLPGVDAAAGVEAGAHLGLSETTALEVAAMATVVAAGIDGTPALAFTGGLRCSLRFESPRTR